MSSQVFYRKWRPRSLSEVVGQEQVTRTLLNALAAGRVSHAYLFCGPRGTGKTSTGRILAKAVNCLTSGKGEPCNNCRMCQDIAEGRAMDVIEIDAASNRGIDDIRDLREKVGYAPAEARYKVYIIDEVHMLSKDASNALLKTLEEPPPHAIFVLATTETHKVLPTIISRCQRFDFRRISQADVAAKLGDICKAEGINMPPEALRLVARATTGSLRDAENLLQQLTTYYGSEIVLKQVQDILGITGDWRAREIVKHIVNKDAAAGVNTIHAISSDGLDLGQFNRELVEYLRMLLLMKTGSAEAVDLTAEAKKELEELAAKASLPQVVRAIKLFAQLAAGLDNYSTLPLELALVECTLPVEEPKTVAARPEPKPVASRPEPRPVARTAAPPAAQPFKRPAPRVETPPRTISPTPSIPKVVKPEPEPEPAAKAEATTMPLEVSSELDKLRLNWRQLIRDAPEGLGRSPAAAFLRNGRPRSVEDSMVTIAFKFSMHKDNMEKADNQKIAEKIIGNFLGRACRVRCICEPEGNHLVEAARKIGEEIIDGEDQ